MWRFVWQELCEVLWLMTMLLGLSLASVTVAASILAIAEMRVATLVPLLAAALY
jgi:hypothetical protein